MPMLGTSPEAIDLAEDRGAFGALLHDGRAARARRTARRPRSSEARQIADEIGYPVLVRPSYVLGGRGMEIVYDEPTLADYIDRATEITADHPVLVDRFLDDAIEIDVDALCDGTEVYLGGVMEHIEEAGIHSGDSACVLPPITLGRSDIAKVRAHTEAHRARGRRARPAQRAVRAQGRHAVRAGGQPAGVAAPCRSSSKATAVPLAKAAARIMLGATIAELRAEGLLPAAGDGGDAAGRRADRGEGGGAAVQPVPHRRRATGVDIAARPGDEVDRRGDGHRRGLRPRVREVPGRRLRLAADQRHGVRLGGQPRTSGR